MTAERATTNGGHAIHSGRRRLERPLNDVPLPLVANTWSALDDPILPVGFLQSCPTLGSTSCGLPLPEAAVRGHRDPATSGRSSIKKLAPPTAVLKVQRTSLGDRSR
ncbi:MAG: hypothetical protein AB7F93_09890 [Immundisolibacter sp.]